MLRFELGAVAKADQYLLVLNKVNNIKLRQCNNQRKSVSIANCGMSGSKLSLVSTNFSFSCPAALISILTVLGRASQSLHRMVLYHR